jgi:fructokinase
VDLSAVQWSDRATRDVYVIRDQSGDRQFSGFGADTTTYADCFIDAGHLPKDAIQVRTCWRRALLYFLYNSNIGAKREGLTLLRAMYAVQSAKFLVTGTLGLAYPSSNAAMMSAMRLARLAGTKVCLIGNMSAHASPFEFEQRS